MREAPFPGRVSSDTRLLFAIQCLGLAAAAVIVFHGGLAYFFSQDDFGWMARARGLLPRLVGPWRYLSAQLYYDAMRAAGLHALPYHLVSLLAHVAVSLLVFALLRGRVAAPAAWLGAVFFAVHPAHYTALYWISATGDILALGLALGAVMAARSADPRRWIAVPLFALSLMSKESTVLLPLWVAAGGALDPGRPAGTAGPAARGPALGRLLDPLAVTLALVSALYLASFVAMDVSGVRRPLPQSAPYALGFDATLLLNLFSYLGWSANFFVPVVSAFSDVVESRAFVPGAAALGLWLAGFGWKALRERGWFLGGALYFALLIPVLPLRNHTCHYYLYAPLAGAAWCVAAAADALFACLRPAPAAATRRGRKTGGRRAHPEPRARDHTTGRVGWTLSLAAGTLLTVNGALLVQKIESHPFLRPELRADPTVDRARIARNVFDGLRAADLPRGVRLLFWSPAATALDRAAGRDPTRDSYWEQNVRGALYGGLAVRVMFPQVQEAQFVRAYRPVDDSHRYAVYDIDGRVRVVAPAEVDSVLRAHPELH